jgi:hypothetical protein
MKWSSSSIMPTLAKGRDLGLGSFGAQQALPSGITPKPGAMAAPVWAPDFLSSAVNDLNDSTSSQSAMQADWRASLLNAIQSGRTDLLPALAAASIAPGAKFSLGVTGGQSAPAKRQPSYWEQKLAMKDVADAQRNQALAKEGLATAQRGGTFWTNADVQRQTQAYQGDLTRANQAEDLARRVAGMPGTFRGMTNEAMTEATNMELDYRKKAAVAQRWGEQKNMFVDPQLSQTYGW